MAISINELKTGLTILLDGDVWSVIEYQHVKPGKGSAFVRTKLKNLKTQAIKDVTFKSDDKIEEAFVEEKKLQFSYSSGSLYHFIDQVTFDEVIISKDDLKDNINFLKDNLEVTAFYYKNELLTILLPNFIDLKVIETEPGIRGDTAKSGTKQAKLETGLIIQVPLFINVGDTIKVDRRTREYIERL